MHCWARHKHASAIQNCGKVCIAHTQKRAKKDKKALYFYKANDTTEYCLCGNLHGTYGKMKIQGTHPDPVAEMVVTLPTTPNHTSIFPLFGGSEEAKSASDALFAVFSSARAQFMGQKLTLTPNMHQTALLHVYNLCCLFLRLFLLLHFNFFYADRQREREHGRERIGKRNGIN